MTKDYGPRRNQPPRLRLLSEETESEKYRRLGWDPRKTYAENMGYEDMFIDDGSLEEPDLTPAPRRRRPSRAARELAADGRGEDTEIAHLTPGELVVPRALQTPEFIAALREAAAAHGIPLEMLSIGNRMNRINPNTGAPEFDIDPGEAQASWQPQPHLYDGPDIEEITVSTPIEDGLVQLPQNLPNSGFYNYGTPGNGAAQYGLPAAMGVIGEAGSRWHASGFAPFGVGNMSLADGSAYDGHKGDHRTGVGIDIRPIRRDGKPIRVDINDPNYDREATQRLVDTLRATGGVKTILFNDPKIKGVSYWDGHDNHMHVRVDPSWKRR